MSQRIKKDIEEIFSCPFEDFELELKALERLKHHDEYSYFHSVNVARISVNLGERLGLDQKMLSELGWSALLHDLGKLYVPLEILNKDAKFEPEELAVMRSHPLESITAFCETQDFNIPSLFRLCAAFEHHQRFDLNGYPQVQTKLNLHPFSRIVAVADTFDAMTTDRIYQRRMLPDVALRIMSQGYGTIFDPVVLQAFVTSMGAYPVGSLVRMSDNRLAVVVKYSEKSQIDRPTLVFCDHQERHEIDLMSEQNLELKILHSEFPEDHGIDLKSYL